MTPPQGSPERSGVPWAFFGLTYGFTWLVLLPALLAARGLIASPLPDLALIALAQFGPSLAAFLLVWRGYALDRLQARRGALTSALVLGVVWGLWHLPLFFLPAAGISVLPFGPWFAQVVASSVLVTWLYNRTGRNLLVALLWHTMNNLALALFPTLDLVPGADPRGFVVQAVLYVLTAAAVVLIWGPRSLSHRGGAVGPRARLPETPTSPAAAPVDGALP